MRYFDLHCDTLSRAYKENKSFYDGDLQINIEKAKSIENYEQCFAHCSPVRESGRATIFVAFFCIFRKNWIMFAASSPAFFSKR